jgi:beta-glucanase (GH16 family)
MMIQTGRNRIAAISLAGLASSLVPAAAQDTRATPDPARFTVVLADDFSNGYRPDLWGEPFHDGLYWNGAWSWDRGDVQVLDGALEVTMTRHADGRWTGGGLNSFKAGHTITYGTVEFDARVEEAQGAMTAILMWPQSNDWPRDGEIDIVETPHRTNMMTSHWQNAEGRHVHDSQFSDAFDASEWNRYRMTWLPHRLTVEVNGQLVAEWTNPDAIPRVPMGFGAMGFIGSARDAWMGGAPDATTPDRVVVQIDNVVMRQWRGE